MHSVTVRWAGAVPNGQPLNPVQAEMPPLVAAMLAELLRDEVFTATAKEHPRAYEGILALGKKIDTVLYQDATQNPAHFDVAPGSREYLRAIRRDIDRVPTEDHTGLHRAAEALAAHIVNSERAAEVPTQYRTGRVPMDQMRGRGFNLNQPGQAND